MVLRFCDFQKFGIEGLTPLSVWVAVLSADCRRSGPGNQVKAPRGRSHIALRPISDREPRPHSVSSCGIIPALSSIPH